jgi:uncharacterized protein
VKDTVMSPRRASPAARSVTLAAALLATLGTASPRIGATAEPQSRDAPGAPRAQARNPANRLAGETSPYLLLHAHNPVDWYPWGPEAFAKARAEGKPIFLSVGYSSCYWCHVMERESFSDPAIARVLNEHFVCVKVDREERPDVDQVYMAALQVFGGGGWPMSMFLTPDGRPFFGGTYFPPADRDDLEGFPSLLKRVIAAWRERRAEVERDAERLSGLVRRTLSGAPALRRVVPLSRQYVAEGRAALAEQYDPEYGGFGFSPENARRPKFPEPVNLVFLLDQHRRDLARGKKSVVGQAGPSPREMVESTLDRMARGGIRDQLAGGYHRYATSRYWIVPHFEKMLYDNAQLASAHLMAYELTGDPRWKAEAEATLAFIARTMTSPEGGFYSSLDAETQGEEGAYYVWTRDEVRRILGDGPDREAFAQVYGLNRDPNFVKDRHVLLQPRTRAEQAAALATTPEALEARLAPLRARLLAARQQRPAPRCDDKIVTSWNGLAIAAYADAYRLLKEPRYRDAANQAADFLLTKLRDGDGRLLRTYRAGRARIPAYLEDHAFLAHGLLRLYAATGDARRLEQARAQADRMLADFADTKDGGFFNTASDQERLIARPRDPLDNVLPSGNSVAVRVLVALAATTKESKYLDAAGRTLRAFAGQMTQAPASMPMMLVALGEYLDVRPEADRPADEAAVLGPVGQGSRDVVTLTGEFTGAPVVGPRSVKLAVVLTLAIKPGWHVYANPTGVEAIPPTRVTLEPGSGWAIDHVDYPPGVAKVLASSGQEKVALYEGKVSLIVHLEPAAGASTWVDTPLKFALQFQACNDRHCLAPAKQGVSVLLPRLANP